MKRAYNFRMAKTVHNKLVRDRIPEIIARNGETAVFRTIEDRGEFVAALAAKILEEAGETKEAAEVGDRDALVKEIADVREVLDALAAEFGISEDDVRRVQTDRREKRGGFGKRLFLESTDE